MNMQVCSRAAPRAALAGRPTVPALARRAGARVPSPVATRVAAIEQEPASQAAFDQAAQFAGAVPAASKVPAVDPKELEELQLEELDATQEKLLAWMLYTDEDAQEEDLDEMVDYDEFDDGEYADLYEEVEELFDEYDYEFKAGDKVMGTVLEVDDDGAYVDVGSKAAAFCPTSECSMARLRTPLEVLRPGMKREFIVVQEEDDFSQIILSMAVIEATVFWQRMRQLMEEQWTVHVLVDQANKGGLLVKYGPYDGFVPVSQFGAGLTAESAETFIGQTLPVKFSEVDEDRERLVFSHKRAAAESSEASGFKVGDVVQGVVQSVKPYGAFVDLGGVTGLLHVSQISHERIMSVDKILAEGDKLKVMILSQDRDRGRVTLSTKKLEPTPGDMLRDPQLVFEKAEEMAALFKTRVEAAQSGMIGGEELPLAGQEGYGAVDGQEAAGNFVF